MRHVKLQPDCPAVERGLLPLAQPLEFEQMQTALPALVLQFMCDDGPGYLGEWAGRRGLALHVVNAGGGAEFPASISGFGGLAVLGGAMSANDDLPCLRAAERLIAQCLARQVPVLGHCLGGQLMARTLGARVSRSPAPEVGWHSLQRTPGADADAWLGDAIEQPVFHWHYEAFDLPAGATALASSPACPVQAFAIGSHLAMQFHVEIDAHKIESWLHQPGERYHAERLVHASVQGADTIRRLSRDCLVAQHQLADRIYGRWASLQSVIPQ